MLFCQYKHDRINFYEEVKPNVFWVVADFEEKKWTKRTSQFVFPRNEKRLEGRFLRQTGDKIEFFETLDSSLGHLSV